MASKMSQKLTYNYPRPALTVDVVIVTREASPKILLIQRASEPFVNQWALPGGFVNENERLLDAALRELREETNLHITEIEQLYTTGDPGRDPRGWTVSVCFLARIDPLQMAVTAGDDAADARWYPLDALPELAFDHAMIVTRAITRIRDRLP